MFQKYPNKFHVFIFYGPLQRAPIIFIPCFSVRAMFEKDPDEFHVSPPHCDMQRGFVIGEAPSVYVL
jgi:hypothetical protein